MNAGREYDTLEHVCTRGHAHPREIACTRREHPANSLVQACPIIGVGIRVSMHTYLPLRGVHHPLVLPPPLPTPRRLCTWFAKLMNNVNVGGVATHHAYGIRS